MGYGKSTTPRSGEARLDIYLLGSPWRRVGTHGPVEQISDYCYIDPCRDKESVAGGLPSTVSGLMSTVKRERAEGADSAPAVSAAWLAFGEGESPAGLTPPSAARLGRSMDGVDPSAD